MPESVPWTQQSFEVPMVLEQLRSQRPGVEGDVWSPTAEERVEDRVPANYQEIVVDTPGPERYLIPPHGEDGYELWRGGVNDMPGAGELIGRENDLEAVAGSAMTAAAAAVDPGRVPVSAWEADWEPLPTVPVDIASWSPRVNSLASQALHGGRSLNALAEDPMAQGDRDELRSAFQQMTTRMDGLSATTPATVAVHGAQESLQNNDLDATLRQLVTADHLHRHDVPSSDSADQTPILSATTAEHQETAVSNAWRSDMTAAAEIQARGASNDLKPSEPLRQEEIELLARVDPAAAETTRVVGGRADWTHRRPERAAEQDTVHERGRSVDGSD